MHSLSDKKLFDSYKKALESNLDKHFIFLLQKEIERRRKLT